MSRLWLVNAWRQHYRSRGELLVGIQRAKLSGFDSYCWQRYGQHWWLCCAPLGSRQQQQHDLVRALRQHYSQTPQLVALLTVGQQLVCVGWDQHQLLTAIAVSRDTEGLMQLQLIVDGLWQRHSFKPRVVLSSDIPKSLQPSRQDIRVQPLSLAQVSPHPSARLVAITQPPSWRRRRQLLGTAVVALVLSAGLTGYYWPPSGAAAAVTAVAAEPPPVAGMPVDSLLLVREHLQQLELVAGWDIQRLQLVDGTLQVVLQQGYGRYGELQHQLQSWQMNQVGQQVTLQRPLSLIELDLEFRQSLSDAQQQLQQQLLMQFPELQWQATGSGSDGHYRWQDVTLQLASWHWLELGQLQQLLQGFDVRLQQLHLSHAQQPIIGLQLRIYESIAVGFDVTQQSQGDDHDTTMDVSVSL